MQDGSLQDQLNAELIETIKARSLDGVRELLRSGADPNYFAHGGITPLHLAAQLGLKEVTDALLIAGADPDSTHFTGIKPLAVASIAGHHDVAHLIREWSVRRQQERTNREFDRLGWSLGGLENETLFGQAVQRNSTIRLISLSLLKLRNLPLWVKSLLQPMKVGSSRLR